MRNMNYVSSFPVPLQGNLDIVGQAKRPAKQSDFTRVVVVLIMIVEAIYVSSMGTRVLSPVYKDLMSWI